MLSRVSRARQGSVRPVQLCPLGRGRLPAPDGTVGSNRARASRRPCRTPVMRTHDAGRAALRRQRRFCALALYDGGERRIRSSRAAVLLEIRYNTHHVFGAAEYGMRSWEPTSLNGTSKAYSLSVGIDPSSQKAKFGFCPMLRWSGLSGPHQINGTPYSFSDQSFAAAFSVGFLMIRTGLWDLMPSANPPAPNAGQVHGREVCTRPQGDISVSTRTFAAGSSTLRRSGSGSASAFPMS